MLLHNFVSDEECQRLVETAIREEGEAGYYTSTDGSKSHLAKKGRGRIYDAATRFGSTSVVTDLCLQAWPRQSTMLEMTCTHVLLLNLYTNSDGLVWYRDIYENDGTSDHPVL